MRVRVDREDVEVHGRAVFVGDEKVLLAGRNVESAIVLELDEHGEPVHRLVGEVKPDDRADGFAFAGGLDVNVEDEVHAGIGAPCHAVGFDDRAAARLPGKKLAVGLEALLFEDHVHAGKARAGGGLAAARRVGTIENDVGVMKDPRIAGPDLDGPYPSRGGDRNGHDEIPKGLAGIGGHGVGAGGAEHEIGLAEQPAGAEARRFHAFARRTGGRSLLHPFGKEPDLGIGEAPLFLEVRRSRLRAARAACSASR